MNRGGLRVIGAVVAVCSVSGFIAIQQHDGGDDRAVNSTEDHQLPTAENQSTVDGTEFSLPPLPEGAIRQLKLFAQIDIEPFDAEGPSLVYSDDGVPQDHNNGKLISQDEAIESVSASTGLNASEVTNAQLVTVLAMPSVEEVDGEPSFFKYSHADAWSVVVGGVDIRQPSKGFAGRGEQRSTPATTTTSMVMFIDAYTGDFLFGGQYDAE